MTRDQLHTVIALLREAARVADGHGTTLGVHECTEDELHLAEEAGGERRRCRRDGFEWDTVDVNVSGIKISFYGLQGRAAAEENR